MGMREIYEKIASLKEESPSDVQWLCDNLTYCLQNMELSIRKGSRDSIIVNALEDILTRNKE